MKQLYRCLLPGCLLGALAARAQAPTSTPSLPPPPARVTVSGYVRDQATGENLIGVAVVQVGTGQGTATNTYGFYSLTLPAAGLDSVRLVASYVGYERQRWAVPATGSARHDLGLPAATNELAGVEVVGDRQAADDHGPRSTRMGTINIPIAQIKSLPKFMGETDVLKVLQLLPGVQSGGEGSSGLYVRGGSPDQNLILLDGTPVYNAAHLFGFFSVFNADALNNVELIKGGFPARYGGRLSSVLDISMKEGNAQQLHGEGAIGLIASRITLEGPIKKDVASFIVSARRTYLDVVAQPLIKWQLRQEGQAGSLGYYFYDLNAKLNWKVGSRDRLYLSAYRGYDKFSANLRSTTEDPTDYRRSANSLGWGNLTGALRWNHVVNDQLFMNTHLTYSQYQFDIDQSRQYTHLGQGQPATDINALNYLSNIKDWSLKTDFDYVPSPAHYLRFGGQLIRHAFRPGAVVQNDNTDGVTSAAASGSRTQGTESAVYVEDDVHLTPRLKVNAGLRLSSFYVDSKLYPSLEPRLAARYMLTDEWALKAAYARTTQYIHLLTNSGIGLPTDLWVPATAAVRPQVAHQFGLGAARTLHRGGEEFELSLEAYYKPMQNLVEYREGASFLNTTDGDWQSKITSGRGWAYGAELFLQKKTGRTTGWLGYTLAWSNRQFGELNQGRIFPYKYDRRHDVSLVVIHHFSPTLTLSGTWVYGTGNATTLSSGRYQLGSGQIFDDYGDRNSYRMAAYHRFDLDLSKTKKKRWGEIVNSLSIYNVYSRNNPYYIYYEAGSISPNGVVNKQARYKQVSLFPIIPSVSKAFKF
ncbi:TonB-dependent receptor [Hymenobacter sp. H14-R3]|uniref:TonB-dependent receptor n=1 Tax=Hymenobacter sp. H14-R3 TaxID=3046308 RepID=UPI0024BB9BF2|nr:TonB-dependent receptor [Hymenobacter sp. H14-R3]MDJ0364460.1 TonB-dependent receptor [Hymenobacter sp. H14-R3]